MNILSAIRKFFSSDLGKTIRNWMGGIGLFLMSLFTGEYTDTMTAFAIRSLMEGKATDARRIYDDVCVPEQENLLREWYRTGSAHRPLVL